MEGTGIKDFTTTSLGLVLAYFLSGLAGLISIALWRCSPSELWHLAQSTFKEEGGAAAVVFLGLLLALLLGAIINGIRMWTVDLLVAKRWDMKPSYFAELNAEDLACVIAAVDEYYRFYQFFGSLIVVAIVSLVALGLGMFHWTDYRYPLALYLILLAAVVGGACLSKKYYVEIASEILGVVTGAIEAPLIKKCQIEPPQATHGVDLNLIVKGKNFSRSSQVCWNGAPLDTTVTDTKAKELHATVPAANVTQGDARVSVIEPEKASAPVTIAVA